MTEVSSISTDKGAAPANLEQPNKPTEVEVKIGDKTVKVDSAVAAALNAATTAAKEAGVSVNTLKAQVAERDALIAAAAKAGQKTEQKAEDGLDVLLFTNPDKAIEQITQTILQKVSAQQAQTTAQGEFWVQFYKDNKDLEDADGYVRYVFARDFDTMKKAGLTVGDAMKKLAETSKTEILKISGKQKGSSRPVGEGGGEGNSRSNERSESSVSEDLPASTSSILLERKAARAAAKQPGRQASKK